MIENFSLALQLIPIQTLHTLYMVVVSAFFAIVIGLPLGIVLYLTDKTGLEPNRVLYRGLSSVIDTMRSFPFAILMLALIPLTRAIIGTSLGTSASIVPLSLAAAPYFARLAEFSFKSVAKELIEASIIMGSKPLQIIRKVVLPESLPRLIMDLTNTLINLTSYSAMAGLIGGGGLGKVAIDYGYYRFNTFIMVTTVATLVILVQTLQKTGSIFSQKILIKRGLITDE